MIQLRLKLFRCDCGWQGQTYARPETRALDCHECGGWQSAREIPARLDESRARLEPMPSEKGEG